MIKHLAWRARLIYGFLVVITIVLGLASRYFAQTLPEFIYNHAGDTLWATMVYFGSRFLFYNKDRSLSIVIAILFSFIVELSQCYQAPWINTIRATRIGALVLGSGFLWIDLVRYTMGVILGWSIDHFIMKTDLLKTGQKT